ncbi:Pre-mRNA-splicing factor slt11 [Ranunculus cassubicifolius]
MATEDNVMPRPYVKFVNLCSPCYGQGMNLVKEDNYQECKNCNHPFAIVVWGCIPPSGFGYITRKTQSICFSCSVLLQSCQCCGVHAEENGPSRRRVDATVDFRELRAKGYNFKKIVPLDNISNQVVRRSYGRLPTLSANHSARYAAAILSSDSESVTLSLEDEEDGRFC